MATLEELVSGNQDPLVQPGETIFEQQSRPAPLPGIKVTGNLDDLIGEEVSPPPPDQRPTRKEFNREQQNALVNFGHSAIRGMADNVASILSLIGQDETSNTVRNWLEATFPTSGGAEGFVGSAIGSTMPVALALAAPPVAPFVLGYYALGAAGQGREAVQAYEEETGQDVSGVTETAVAAGYGIAVFAAEKIGLKQMSKYINRLSPTALGSLYRAHEAGNARHTAKVFLREAKKIAPRTAILEGSEEAIEGMLTNAFDKLYDPDSNITSDIIPNFLGGAIGGAMLGPVGLGISVARGDRTFEFDPLSDLETTDEVESRYDDDVVRIGKGILKEAGKQRKGEGRSAAHQLAVETALRQRDRFRDSLNLPPEDRPANAEQKAEIYDEVAFFLKERQYSVKEKMEKVKIVNLGSTKEKALYEIVDPNHPMDGQLATPEILREKGFDVPQEYVDQEVEVIPNIEDYASRYAKDKMSDAEYKRTVVDWLDVENPFKKANAPNTGLNIKTMYSKITKTQEQALTKMGEMVQPLLDALPRTGLLRRYDETQFKTLVTEAIFATEDETRMQALRDKVDQTGSELSRAQLSLAEQLNAYGEAMKQGYHERGVKIDFARRIRNEILRQMKELENHNNEATEQYRKLQEAMDDAENLNYVHIPAALWLDNLTRTNPRLATQWLKIYATAKKRKTLRVRDLVDKGLIDEKDVTLDDIMLSYSRRAGRDFAILDIVSSAEKEGLSISEEQLKERGVTIPKSTRTTMVTDDQGVTWHRNPYNAPVTRDYWHRGPMADWMHDLNYKYSNYTQLETVMNTAKMLAFTNPLFLPMYDLIQGTMLGVVNPLKPFKTAGHFKAAVKDVFEKTQEYWDASEHGLGSTPFAPPIDDARREFAERLRIGRGSTKLRRAQQEMKRRWDDFIPNKIMNAQENPVAAYYRWSWDTAWTLDRVMRQASYRHLISKGFTPKEAAQQAALYHGDYASVPSKTRSTLNKFFFTPTFKIAMGKLFLRMVKDTGAVINPKIKSTRQQKINAAALLRTAAILESWHLLMLTLGFEEDEWGRRYKKKVDTEKGEREIALTWSGPHNMWLKFYYRAVDSFDPIVANPWERLISVNRWEIHPVWRTAYALVIENRKGDGSRIYHRRDPREMQWIDSMDFIAQEITPVFRWLADEPFESPEADEALAEEFEAVFNEVGAKAMAQEAAKLLDLMTDPFTFRYMRLPAEQRKAFEIDQLTNEIDELKTEVYNDAAYGQPGSNRGNEMLKRMPHRMERIIGIIRKKAKELDEISRDYRREVNPSDISVEPEDRLP